MNLRDLPSATAILRDSADSVLFVTSQLRPRELKMADGLRRLGWKVGVIYYKWTPFDPRGHFDFSVEVSSAKEAHDCSLLLAPRVCHVFSGAIDDLVLTFCRDKPSPVVIDLNDIFAPSLFNYCQERFEPTREALALAEGFCARDLQLKSAERIDHFQLPPKLLFFPEYCWNKTNGVPTSSGRGHPDEVHVVSVGTFSLETQGMYDSCYLRLSQLLIAQGIHLHIYPHWAYRRDHFGSPHVNFERDFAEFLALEKSSPYLHVHESLSIDELAEVLPQYDFGIVSGGCVQFGQTLKFYHPAYIESCYSGRISDYLDARLPILINDEVSFDHRLLKHYGVCVDLKGVLRPGFRQALLEVKRDARSRQLMEHAAKQFSVDSNSPRLGSFYREIIAAGIVDRVIAGDGLEQARVKKLAEADAMGGGSPMMAAGKLNVLATNPFAVRLRRMIRWISPRAAKILLPYRAIRIFERRLHNSLQQNQSNEVTIAALQSKLETAESNASIARIEVKRLEMGNANLLTRAADLEERAENFAAVVKTLEEQGESLRSNSAEVQSKLEGLRQSDEVLRAQNRELRWDKEALAETVRALKEEGQRLRGDSAQLQSRLEGLRQSDAALRAQYRETQRDKEALAALVRTLQEQGERFRTDNEQLQARLENLQQSDAALRARSRELQGDKDALAALVKALEEQAEGLRRESEELQARLESLQQSELVQRAHNQALQQDKKALAAVVKSVEAERENLRQTHSVLVANGEELEKTTVELRAHLEELNRELAEASQQIHILANEKFILQQEAKWGKLPINEIAGALNWPEVVKDVERTNGFKDLIRILGLFSGSANVADNPSACWDLLASKNYDQLLTFGYRDFKRTVGTNYFNFLVQTGDPQIRAVESLLPPEVTERCRSAALAIPEEASLPCPDQFAYKYFVLLLWEYVKTIDQRRHFEKLEEPAEGNPMLVASEGRRVSQDLANALIEYCAIGEAVSFEDIDSVLEIGGGYGRNAYIILALNPNIKVTMVDIPPALYIAQRYLASVFKERRVFKARNFSRYGEVKGELEAASIVFLLPHQLALVPKERFDLSMNISSFGEMRTDQVQWYFTQLERVTRRYFYVKQWRTSTNVFDEVVLKEANYPWPKKWRPIFSRPCRVQTEFFEACYQVK